ncbi:MAG: hypothetical protein GC191_07415 [Azospirillum sp.]|nr:hypothetical protein [Azospirillum sp.]
MRRLRSGVRLGVSVLLVLGAGAPGRAATAAAAKDIHQFWDAQCAHCHGHAERFARTDLVVKAGRLQGRRIGYDLRRFLPDHGVPAELAAPIYAMLLAQAATAPRFKQNCARCHGAAADFARSALSFKGQVLYGTETGMPVTDFLATHRALAPEDAAFFASLLARVKREVGPGQ